MKATDKQPLTAEKIIHAIYYEDGYNSDDALADIQQYARQQIIADREETVKNLTYFGIDSKESILNRPLVLL